MFKYVIYLYHLKHSQSLNMNHIFFYGLWFIYDILSFETTIDESINIKDKSYYYMTFLLLILK